MSHPAHTYDVLIVGAGGAGLRAAIEAAASGVSVGLICKSLLGKAHTVMAEGGMAAAMAHNDDRDSCACMLIEADTRRMVEVKHAGGFSTRYGHLSKVLVKEGQEVSAGDVVGKVGSSGRSTGPHLHYEIRRNGDALNPVRFLKAGKKVSQYL